MTTFKYIYSIKKIVKGPVNEERDAIGYWGEYVQVTGVAIFTMK
jgi:hypothetical protein